MPLISMDKDSKCLECGRWVTFWWLHRRLTGHKTYAAHGESPWVP